MRSLLRFCHRAALLGALAVLSACGGDSTPSSDNASTPTNAAVSGFAPVSVEAESYEGRPAALLTFSQPLASAQKFDELMVITGDKGETVSGSWSLTGDLKQLRFPYLDANKTYKITIKGALAAADGHTIGTDVPRDLYTGPLEPLLGFASQGSVLPTHETRGLPIITVNVPAVDLEFMRVRDKSVQNFLAEMQKNGRRGYWSLDTLTRYAEPVYANRFALEVKPNERTVTYIPVRDIAELKNPGLYFAVMKRPAQFTSEYDTAMFFVSDIGLHARLYGTRMLVHTASLESGEPKSGVTLSVRNEKGEVVVTGETDGDGLATLDYTFDARHVLVAERGSDVSFLPFNQPALDLSEFSVAGRPQRAAEVFPWSGRDLYRPGETLRVAALLRDQDGKFMPPQPLFATLRQPDGRTVIQQQVSPGELGYYEFTRDIALDAPTGRWSLDFSTDPKASKADHAFVFRVEEFLPERLKLDLNSSKETLKPGEALPVTVEAAYLYGAPAAGNRFTAKLAVGRKDHPVATLKDFYFGDALMSLPKEITDAVDTSLDEDGKLAQDIEVLKDTTITGPVSVMIQGSVYETGGRAVSRNLERVVWPAPQLIGARPMFELSEGSPSNGQASFELVRTDASGELLPATGLQAKLIREYRDYHWTFVADMGWKAEFTARYETIEEQKIDIAAGGRAKLNFNVDWGPYRLEVLDPTTQLTLRLPFNAGWGWDDNRGDEARPDKVKVALDKVAYGPGDTLVATLTPPHEGPALIMLEGDELLWHTTANVRAGTRIEIPLDPSWQRHDLYVTALVFRPGSSAERVTPNRAIGVAWVPMARDDRKIAVKLDSPETSRPNTDLRIKVEAPALAGQTARVRVTAVDAGVLNITRFPLPDAAAWFFAQRRLGIDAYDLYSRVIESLDGAQARLRYGGDQALAALPAARRPNADVKTVDLFQAPVALDAQGKAEIALPVPDFNGTLRVRALVFGEDRYGAAEHESIVRAPLVAEASTPRVMAPGDSSTLTLDLTNLSGKAGDFEIALSAEGPVSLGQTSARVSLDDQAKRTLRMPLRATGAFGAARITARIKGPEVNIERHFSLVVRPAWGAVARVSSEVLDAPRTITPSNDLLAGLHGDSIQGRITVSTLPPLPFAQSARELVAYPYGCAEQTTSKAYPLVWLDENTIDRLGVGELTMTDPFGRVQVIDAPKRAAMLEAAFARLTSMQTDNGHFAMWPGASEPTTAITPYVAELFLNARDAGIAIPEQTLERALVRLNEDLLSGGNTNYEYDNYEHMRLAEMAYGAYVLARARRAPVGTLRAMFDNERSKFVVPMPLAHLGAALALMGDKPRAEKAFEEAFSREFQRPDYLGDYGSTLRDTAWMLALAHENGLSKPEYDARAIEAAREWQGRGDVYLSTQDQQAIFRLGHDLIAQAPRSFAASVRVGGSADEVTGRAVISRAFTQDDLARGLSITPSGGAPLYVVQDVAGTPTRAQPTTRDDLRITRKFYTTDGEPWKGGRLNEGDLLIGAIEVRSNQAMNDALVVDLVAGGLEVENLNLTDASQWENVTLDGVTLSERGIEATIRFEEYRDDRYVAAIQMYAESTAKLYYLVRAVSPGDYIVPPPTVEDMYRPSLRAVGQAVPERVQVGRPE